MQTALATPSAACRDAGRGRGARSGSRRATSVWQPEQKNASRGRSSVPSAPHRGQRTGTVIPTTASPPQEGRIRTSRGNRLSRSAPCEVTTTISSSRTPNSPSR